MSQEVVSRAAAVLRETTRQDGQDGQNDDDGKTGAETLKRVLGSMRRQRRRRRLVTLLAIQVGFGGMALGAWAASTGRLAAWMGYGRRTPVSVAAPASTRALRPHAHRGPMVVPIDEPLGEPPVPAVSAQQAAEPLRVRPAVAPPVAVSPAPRSTSRSAEEIYREAHETHFTRRDFSAALVLWEEYLAVGGGARFSVEARFNRAIALIRLGRGADASRALQPFAEGDYGDYRRRDAQALLRRIAGQ